MNSHPSTTPKNFVTGRSSSHPRSLGAVLSGRVVAVSRSPEHALRKPNQECVRLLPGLGVEGDVHLGKTVKHRSRVRRDPTRPNLRQVHLVHSELLEELGAKGIPVLPGAMGENITTRGIDISALPTGAILHLGQEAKVRITGLRSPCSQLDSIHEALKSATLGTRRGRRIDPEGGDHVGSTRRW